ncbi:MAG TPA: pyridoxal-phosphate dependent enzyme [Euzebyales bacterium]|nr:pyridoxal-phosphate dependent enzyme [Euzebyales bacterium]
MAPPVTPDDVRAARARISGRIRTTPLERSDAFGPTIAVKAEHLQVTRSFKIRGALNKLSTFDDRQRRDGVIAASTGNHGIAVATAGGMLAVPVSVVVARSVDPTIVRRLERLGAAVDVIDSDDALDAEHAARRRAGERGVAFVSPYNDPAVIAGQGTVAIELLSQLEEVGWSGVDSVVVAVGGGGLISGIATWLRHAAPDVEIVGASPANDAAMADAVAAGGSAPAAARPTLSHSTAGGIEDGAVTVPLCRDLVDRWVRVDEHDIAAAVRTMIEGEHQLVEGAAGVALAAAADAARAGGRVVAISCGARITPAELASVLATEG